MLQLVQASSARLLSVARCATKWRSLSCAHGRVHSDFTDPQEPLLPSVFHIPKGHQGDALAPHCPTRNFSKLIPSLICTVRVAFFPSFHSTVMEYDPGGS